MQKNGTYVGMSCDVSLLLGYKTVG